MNNCFSLERFNIGFADARTPWMPNDAFLKAYMEDMVDYPSPYPEDITPGLLVGRNNYVESENGTINYSSSIIHSLEKVDCVAADAIMLHLGSVIVGQEISLRAPIVKIYDEDDKWPIRTTLLAKEKLNIQANIIIIEGADIPPPKLYSLKAESICVKNVTRNTQWLIDLIEN